MIDNTCRRITHKQDSVSETGPTNTRSTYTLTSRVLLLSSVFWGTNYAYADLNAVPGLTEPQAALAAAIQSVCPQLAGLGDTRTTVQTDLFTVCRAMVQTSNDLQGQGPADFSLGISNEELAATLQQVAHEETAAPGTIATKTVNGQLSNIGSRLQALRAGATGVQLSGLNFIQQDQQFTLNDLGFYPAFQGGAAGDDTSGVIDAGSRWGVFLNGNVGTGEKNSSSRENSFDLDSSGITLGVDYRVSDQWVVGAAAGVSSLEAEFQQSATVGGGDVESDGTSFSLYSTFFSGSFFLDGIITLGQNDYEMTRVITFPATASPQEVRTATSDTDSDQLSISFGGGIEFVRDTYTYGPYARIEYLDSEISEFEETGANGLNLLVSDQEVSSLRSVIGAQFSNNISKAFGVMTPYFRIEYHHEFDNDSRSITAKYANDPFDVFWDVPTDDPDRNFMLLGAGISTVYKGGTQAFINYERLALLSNIDNEVITAGIRTEF